MTVSYTHLVPATTWLIVYDALTCTLSNGSEVVSFANINFLAAASHFTVNNPLASVCTSSPATLFGKVTCVLIVQMCIRDRFISISAVYIFFYAIYLASPFVV